MSILLFSKQTESVAGIDDACKVSVNKAQKALLLPIRYRMPMRKSTLLLIGR